MKTIKKLLCLLILMSFFVSVNAQNSLHACVIEQFEQVNDQMTVAELRQKCLDLQVKDTVELIQDDVVSSEANESELEVAEDSEVKTDYSAGIIGDRFISERATASEPFVLTPHKMNYILPVYSTNAINKEVYQDFNGYEENLEDLETKFQLSFKVPLNTGDVMFEGDGLYLGFTLQAWWQVYSSNISKPFRETNYQPELFYITPMNWHPFGGNTGLVLGVEHQSNGRGQGLSRSWNRIYGNFLFDKNKFALSLRPWVRIAEDEKEFGLDSDGDDNPDIEDFMGHFELDMVYKWDQIQLYFKGRQNFSTKKGFGEVSFTFPLWGKLRGYASASDGYGDSLIDYNYSQSRFGVGFALNDLL